MDGIEHSPNEGRDEPGRPLLRMSEVSQALGIARSTAYMWAKAGRLPVVRREGGLYVPRAALAAFLAAEADAALENLRDAS